ncbi:hypothetical protein EVAR_21720_1 [Eumeta japonica]|uniref:Uncharacterized protein n=1 Tax=Eumeta variegata TaxID=151549 RepID=A0A4C1W8U2_EUMVA|nr:hypothetical protein EVAR_21720_1 [Eumeta japonica]
MPGLLPGCMRERRGENVPPQPPQGKDLRATTHRLSFSQLDSLEHTVEIEKGQEIEEEKEGTTTTATAVAATPSATNGTEGAKTPPIGDNEKIRASPGQTASPKHTTTTATTARLYIPTPITPTTSKADREITSTSHHIRSGPRGGQPETNDVRHGTVISYKSKICI